jgi:hypothetical protein
MPIPPAAFETRIPHKTRWKFCKIRRASKIEHRTDISQQQASQQAKPGTVWSGIDYRLSNIDTTSRQRAMLLGQGAVSAVEACTKYGIGGIGRTDGSPFASPTTRGVNSTVPGEQKAEVVQHKSTHAALVCVQNGNIGRLLDGVFCARQDLPETFYFLSAEGGPSTSRSVRTGR